MRVSIKSLAIVVLLLALSSFAFTAAAQDEAPPPNLADMWIVHVQPGMASEFETAFTAHLAVRAEHSDTRNWATFTPVIGSDLGYYAIRACCFDWAGADAYVAWSQGSTVGEHWDSTVDQYVESYEHYFSALDFENSNWPENGDNISLVGVTNWTIKPGASADMNAAKAKMSAMAKEHGWPRHWSWSSEIGGASNLTLASPYENYAGMKAPEQSFADFLTEHMGSRDEALELLNSFSSSASDSSYTVYRHRPDLSMGSDD